MTIIQTDDDARDNDVRGHGEAVKHIRHPVLGPSAFEYSVFAVDGRMVVYNPATPADLENQFDDRISARARTHMIIAPNLPDMARCLPVPRSQ